MDLPYNFGGLPEEYSSYEKSSIVILPVPFDKTSTWQKGADKGPDAVIKASQNMELYDIETDSEVYKKGIYTGKEITEDDSEKMLLAVKEKVLKFNEEDKFVVGVGGEHSITTGFIRAHAENKDLSVLHLDAHADTRDSYEGNKYSHASVIARVKEVAENVVSVGVRSMDSSERDNINSKKMFYAKDIQGPVDWYEKVLDELFPDVYITIDLDVFDPSIMPSTGTPEPGGLDWYSVSGLLKKVARTKNIIGADVVELSPSENKAPDFLAAKLIYKLLSYKYC
ncbi:MAG: agmatinase [Elusimicrobiota bacterium]